MYGQLNATSAREKRGKKGNRHVAQYLFGDTTPKDGSTEPCLGRKVSHHTGRELSMSHISLVLRQKNRNAKDRLF
jgi:hypothetical protein